MTSPAAEAATESNLPRRTAQALYMQAPVSNITVVAIATLYYFVLRTRIDADLLGLWTLLMIATAALRLALWYGYSRVADRPAGNGRWLNAYTAACVVVGTAWGSIQLMSGDFSDLLLVVAQLLLFFGVMSSAVSILACHLPAFIGYCVPQVLLLATAILRTGESTLYILIIALFIYLLMLTLFARNARRQFVESDALITENETLVEQLHRENEEREAIIEQRTQTLADTNALLQEQIAERVHAEEALREQKRVLEEMAQHDALTGLPNRVLLADRLTQSIARAKRHPAVNALLFIDLDHFKQINDSLGHSAGDELLNAVSRRLQALVRSEDTVARLGGDEFILIVEGLADIDALKRLAEKVLAVFSEPFAVEDNAFSIGASIGISIYPQDGDDPETLLRNADAAMYRAKADGRGAFRFYSTEMTEQARSRLAIEADLRVALSRGEFELYYQPLIALDSDRVVGAEALLRWNHPELGLIMPGSFIHVAEESSLINRVGLWVLRRGCQQLKQWEDRGLANFTLAINLSGREFWNNPLLENIERVIGDSQCSPAMLELEITESYLVHRPEQSKELISALRERGISIAVDDFGTGYSSLGYLKQFPITKLKIDQSFVRDVPTDTDDQAIVRAIIALGHSLDLKVTGEGVENEVQADFLRREGCDLAQGYFYARPMPAESLEALILEGADQSD